MDMHAPPAIVQLAQAEVPPQAPVEPTPIEVAVSGPNELVPQGTTVAEIIPEKKKVRLTTQCTVGATVVVDGEAMVGAVLTPYQALRTAPSPR